MEVFDAPEPMVTCPRSESSTTAPQSLTLLNGAFVVERSRALSRKKCENDSGGCGRCESRLASGVGSRAHYRGDEAPLRFFARKLNSRATECLPPQS